LENKYGQMMHWFPSTFSINWQKMKCMKNYVCNMVTLILLCFALTVKSQALLPNQQLKKAPINKEDNFFEIQQQFNDYWNPKNVVNGYYEENGVQKKAYGWKQFKRWEWYWNNRVNPTTGQFPDKRASDFYVERAITSTSRNATGNWTALGPSLSSGGYSGLGRLNCIAFRPGDNSVFYVGAPSGGLWKTTDGGSSWNVLTDQNAVLGVSDAIVIAGATTNSDIVYIATGDRDGGSMWSLGGGQYHDNNSVGVLKSIDGGTTWSTTGLSFTTNQIETVNRLLLDTDDNNTLYAATSDGFYRTTDAGVNWSNLYSTEFVDIEFNPLNDQIIYGSTRWGKIYLSTDGGVSWSIVMDDYSSDGRRIDLAVSVDEPTWVYAVEVNTSGGLFGVYKSINSGASYSLIYNTVNLLGNDCNGVNSGGQGSYDLAIAADPNDANKVFIGGVNTWSSSNGGVSWSSSNMWTSSSTYNSCGSPVVHADKHFFAYQLGSSTMFECNDGGLYKTSDHGNTWTHLSNGLEISQLYRLAVAQTTNNDVIAGLQDCGTKSMRSGTWTDVIGGDGMDCIIDYTDEDIQYGESQYGGLYRTINKWSSSTPITSGLSGSPYWVMPLAIDPTTHTTIYAGLQDVFKSTDKGDSWLKISAWNGNTLKELAVAPSNSNYIYTTTQSVLYRTTDGGTNWSDITGTLPTSSALITYIAIKDDDPNTVWVSMGQYDANGVYETTDGGTTWTNISTGLPTIPVMCVVQNKQNTTQTELYAGTDVGIYVKVGGGAWALYSDGLPNVVVNELKIYYNTTTPSLSRLRAATSGRGVWESELYSPPNSPPVADFLGDILYPGVGQTVTFSDLSSNVPTSWLWSFTPSTVTFVGGTSATSQNPQVQFNAEGDYTVQLTATNAYGSDIENKNNYILASSLLNYCVASGGGDQYLSGIQIGTIVNTGTGDNGYSDYTSISTDFTVNQSYDITVTYGFAYTSNDLGIWIDWNHDGDFDDTEENVLCNIGLSYYTETYVISVPEDALLGSTTMRIRMKYFDENCGIPCGTTTYGEVEDYKINVLPASNTWIGTSTDWNSASNWSDNTVPTSSYNITIPTAPSGGNYPVIQIGTTAKCNTLTIESGATITVNGTLEVEK
jgi:PKD repeat protein